MNYWQASTSASLSQLKVDEGLGLTSDEARRRLDKHGENLLESSGRKTAWQILKSQFSSMLIWFLLASALVSGIVLQEWVDATVILIVILINTAIGFYQEYEAESAIEKLQSLAHPFVRVKRDGIISDIDSAKIVPGDIMFLEAGKLVCADGRILSSENLQTQESALTGESLPISKHNQVITNEAAAIGDRTNMVFSGTMVTKGRASILVTATGLSSELGNIARLLAKTTEEPSVLQTQINQLTKHLIIICLLLIAIFGVIGHSVLGLAMRELFLTGVSLAVAAIPEGLPALLTISLAIGAKKMLENNALVRKLSAVETLGSVTTICTDKTGTLTCNNMRVEKEDLIEREKSLLCLALCNDVIEQNGEFLGDPTEVALVRFAGDNGKLKNQLEINHPRVAEIPFESERKTMTTVHRQPGQGLLCLTKGAPENVLSRCTSPPDSTVADKWASAGIRVLAVAYKEQTELDIATADEDLQFAGLVGLLDPLRDDSATAVAACISARVRVMMITGDHPKISEYIGDQLSIRQGKNAVIGAQIDSGTGYDIKKDNLYARVSPENKLMLVNHLQKEGQIVAMTGDGVNDSPALKAADIGIAMGIAGSDVAKQASDIVLLDDHFSTIVETIEQGRILFDNLIRFIRYMLTANFAEVMTMILAPVVGLPLPLLPVQILWMNLVTDGLPALALGVEPAESNVMQRPPRKPYSPIISLDIFIRIITIGSSMALLTFLISTEGRSVDTWRTMVFSTLVFSQITLALSERSLFGWAIFKKKSNHKLTLSLIVTLLLQLAVIYTPFGHSFFHTQSLTATEISLCMGLSLILFLIAEIQKMTISLFPKLADRSSSTR